MYCPKCGAEAVEGQRYCRACGTDLQLINTALKSEGKGPGPFNFDAEEIGKNIADFVNSWKKGFQHEHAAKWKGGWEHYRQGHPLQSARDQRRKVRDEARRRNLPQPSQWMKYSRQHNFKEGLISLFSGAGLALLFHKLGQAAISSHVLETIPRVGQNESQLHGLEMLVNLFWLFMLIPVLKGLGQIIYASFFAESMQTLSERFTIPADELDDPRPRAPRVERDTAPQAPASAQTRDFERLNEPPPSVTEGTTQFFEEARAQRRRESQ